ncbi:putative phosphoribosyltransferase [Halomonas fontilapidosi]|uniref:Putative phosphoribosyltransferase n=1 Tax=Halomonas fontilapidosi TaxID=616675 RepID=A0A7W5GZY7_9GAMM|nr:phosphoribosyltransferase family protein [Halomonas fontilapidosi]MBB3185120.1 putative phosphoribosyltransferase [Halomonas fontilapidosi]
MFRDRLDAAEQLASRLSHLKGHDPLILAIPRGAVPMGRLIADALEGDLDVVLVRKVGAPGNPEFAIGAVSEDGSVALEETAKHYREEAVNRQIQEQRELLEERRQRYTPVRAPIDPKGRTVVVVDDGSATGATMAAALSTLQSRGPQTLIAAMGAAPPDTVARLEPLVDEVVCLEIDRDFRAVGQYFAEFGQVEEDEVIELLGSEHG